MLPVAYNSEKSTKLNNESVTFKPDKVEERNETKSKSRLLKVELLRLASSKETFFILESLRIVPFISDLLKNEFIIDEFLKVKFFNEEFVATSLSMFVELIVKLFKYDLLKSIFSKFSNSKETSFKKQKLHLFSFVKYSFFSKSVFLNK